MLRPDSTLPTPGRFTRWTTVAICLALAASTLLVFGSALRCGFISFDDDKYVDHNPALTAGLTTRGLAWAFTTNLTRLSETAEYWEPLTLLSRLADYQVYGFAPWGHHLTGVLIHLATGLALFGALRRLTGADGRSAIVAALFLVHPMHVEPVLWLSARKDLVNGFFYVLTLWTYGWYAERPGARRYAAVFAAVLAANMGKPMAVSLPLVLLLLDLWPLRRWTPGSPGWPRRLQHLIWEKVPLLVLSAGVAALAYVVQEDIGALAGDDMLPLPWRMGNAALAAATYVSKAFAPVDLAFFYPHPGRNLNLPIASVAGLGMLVASAFAVGQWRSRPWWSVGWGWFLVVLAPVIGFVQIGDQAMADRYSYLAFIGLFIAVVWEGAEWSSTRAMSTQSRDRRAVGWLVGGVLAIFSIGSFLQVQTWRTSETVFTQAIEATSENYLAHYNLGAVLLEQGRRAEAMPHLAEAVRIRAPILHQHLVAADEAERRGSFAEAIPRLNRILLITPWDAALHRRLGLLLARQHEPGKALMQFDAALKYRPEWLQPRIDIAAVLLAEKETDKAGKILHGVLAQDPDNTEARQLREALAAVVP